MNSSRTRQLVIGLDALEWDLLTRWSAAGKLPTFRRLLEEGTHAQLAGVANSLPDVSWQALCSGLSPAWMARYFYVQNDPATGGMRYMPDDTWGVKFFWNHLAEAGVPVGVVDIPHIVAHEDLRGGFQLSWGTHGLHGERFSTPDGMLAEVDRRFGRHLVGECDAANSNRQRKAMLPRLIEGVRQHGALYRHFICEREWEVLIGVFSAPHCAGHMYWHDLDPAHPAHDADDPYQFANAIEEVYRAIDTEVGSMIEAAGPGVRIYLTSPLGMGPLYHASWNLPDMLDCWGYGSAPGVGVRREETARASVNLWRILRMVMPGRLQYATYAMLPQRIKNELLFRFYRGNRSWENCRAFSVPNNDVIGAIRINLKGRDFGGKVEPAEYERVCEDLCASLGELTDPVSGRPVAEHISRIHREMRGPHVDELPDLTVRWNTAFPWSAVHSPRFGTMQLREQDSRSGSHTTHAFLIATGDSIGRGATISDASLYDFVPTILKTAGLRAPEGCEGRPLF